MTKREAYEAGLNGLDAPAVRTKHVRQFNPISALWEEGDVETDASMSLRHAWQKGRKLREVREYIATKQPNAPL